MIKFFRKIRQQLLTENKFSKYLIYAIGEIILVVIGILVALKINNANETKKNNIREQEYLTSIKEEIKHDSLTLESGWFKNYTKKINALERTKRYILGTYIPKDTIQFINNAGYGAIYSRASFNGTSKIYKELLNTGNLSLISNSDIRNQIIEYYDRQEFTIGYANNIRTEYATYMNSVKSYNPKSQDVNRLEIPRMLAMIKTEECHSLINQELSFAYAINRHLEIDKTLSHKLHHNIKEFLKNKDSN